MRYEELSRDTKDDFFGPDGREIGGNWFEPVVFLSMAEGRIKTYFPMNEVPQDVMMMYHQLVDKAQEIDGMWSEFLDVLAGHCES